MTSLKSSSGASKSGRRQTYRAASHRHRLNVANARVIAMGIQHRLTPQS